MVPVRTLVIDNNSMPATARAVAAVCEGRERTELLRSERNLGCAGGRRHGAELAETELVLFIDDDIELMPGALEHLLSELDGHPEADAVTGTVVNSDGMVMHSGGPIDVLNEIVTFGLLGNGAPVASIDLPPSGPSGWAPGGAVLVRGTVLDEHPIDATMERTSRTTSGATEFPRLVPAASGARARRLRCITRGARSKLPRILLPGRGSSSCWPVTRASTSFTGACSVHGYSTTFPSCGPKTGATISPPLGY